MLGTPRRMLLQMRSDPDVATNIGCAVSWSSGGEEVCIFEEWLCVGYLEDHPT